MKKTIVIVAVIVLALINAETAKAQNLEKLGKIEFGLHGVAYGFEIPLSNSFTWYSCFGAGMGMGIFGGKHFTWDLANPIPFFKSQIKWVYNIDRRIARGRNVLNNSGNYLAIQSKYSFGDFPEYFLTRTLLTEIHWGIQRNLGGNFIFNFHLGLGYSRDFYRQDGLLIPTLGLIFSFNLF